MTETFILMLIILFLLGGPVFVRKFLRGYFRGVDLYVFLTLEGQTVAFKNPRGIIGQEDKAMEVIPHHVAYSDRFESYYNICWFDSGSLQRCEHSFHRTPQSALYCDTTKRYGCLVGKVFEEQ
jgi:hypothetical protein